MVSGHGERSPGHAGTPGRRLRPKLAAAAGRAAALPVEAARTHADCAAASRSRST